LALDPEFRQGGLLGQSRPSGEVLKPYDNNQSATVDNSIPSHFEEATTMGFL
jgi:hypothetical protein